MPTGPLPFATLLPLLRNRAHGETCAHCKWLTENTSKVVASGKNRRRMREGGIYGNLVATIRDEAAAAAAAATTNRTLKRLSRRTCRACAPTEAGVCIEGAIINFNH